VARITAWLLLGSLAAATPDDTTRLLFVGNSHTYVNQIPLTVRNMAESGGHPASCEQSAVGGYRLEQHALLPATLDLVARGGWTWVILQEQSQVPAIDYWRFGSMYPACRVLDSLLRAAGSRTMLYLTWGWRDGGTQTYGGHSSPPFADYFEMQDSVTVAYQVIGAELGAAIAPVGEAWRRARENDSAIALWQADACHATPLGSYLAACVFYAVVFGEPPSGRWYPGDVLPEEASLCQRLAWETVSGVGGADSPRSRTAPGTTALPSPCTDRVTIRAAGAASLAIHDATGRLVRTLSAARGGATWDCSDESGRRVPPGSYFALPRPGSAAAARIVVR
jgi:hypothetical protein